MSDRLERQLAFIVEVDRLKTVLRRTVVTAEPRNENSAEHSWHVALMAMLLAEHGPAEVDVARTVRMLLVHDVVEIDAGDTFCYDADAVRGQEERERRAAERLFGLLPADQERELFALWEEFEAQETPESRYARALDCLQAVMLNAHSEGHSWRRHRVRREQVLERIELIRRGAPELWRLACRWVDDAVERGWIRE